MRALDLLAACQSQWQPILGALGGLWWRGASWANVAQAMAFMAVPAADQPELWQQYRLMEAEALSILQEQANKAMRTK